MPSNAAKGNRLTSSAQEVVISGVLLKLLFLSGSTFVSDKEMLRKLLKNNLQYGKQKKLPLRKVFLWSGDGLKSRSNHCSTKDEALKR